jgi:hypothetical protein
MFKEGQMYVGGNIYLMKHTWENQDADEPTDIGIIKKYISNLEWASH